MDTRPGQGNGRRAIRVGKSEPGRRVFHARGHRRVSFAISAVSVPHPPCVPCHAPRRDNVRDWTFPDGVARSEWMRKHRCYTDVVGPEATWQTTGWSNSHPLEPP